MFTFCRLSTFKPMGAIAQRIFTSMLTTVYILGLIFLILLVCQSVLHWPRYTIALAFIPLIIAYPIVVMSFFFRPIVEYGEWKHWRLSDKISCIVLTLVSTMAAASIMMAMINFAFMELTPTLTPILFGYHQDSWMLRKRRYIPWHAVFAPIFILCIMQLIFTFLYFGHRCVNYICTPKKTTLFSFGLLYYALSQFSLLCCFALLGFHFEFPLVPWFHIAIAFAPLYPLEIATMIIVFLYRKSFDARLWIPMCLFGPCLVLSHVAISCYELFGSWTLLSIAIPWTCFYSIILATEGKNAKKFN